jgi:uncharacterized membrane protein
MQAIASFVSNCVIGIVSVVFCAGLVTGAGILWSVVVGGDSEPAVALQALQGSSVEQSHRV